MQAHTMRKIALVDPAVFTEDYDVALYQALSQQNEINVTLFGSPKAHHGAFVPHFFRSRLLHQSAQSKTTKLLKVLCYIKDWLRLLKRVQPVDVIHMQWCCLPLIDKWFINRLKQRGIKTVLTVHDPEPFNNNPSSRWQLKGWRSLLTTFDHLIVHSQQGKQHLIKLGISLLKCHVIHHGILRFSSSNTPYQGILPTDKTTLLVFGELKPYKGINILLHALTHLKADVREQLHLLIVGRAKMDTMPLQQFCMDHRLNNQVTWDIRFIPEEEIHSLFSRVDVFCFPYTHIDTSGVFMGCLPYGKAIIASNIGAFQEHLENHKSALLCPPNDSAALARALEICVTQLQIRQHIGHHAKHLAQHAFDWNLIAQQTIQLYQQLVENTDDIAPPHDRDDSTDHKKSESVPKHEH